MPIVINFKNSSYTFNSLKCKIYGLVIAFKRVNIKSILVVTLESLISFHVVFFFINSCSLTTVRSG